MDEIGTTKAISVSAYERLKLVEKSYFELVNILARANVNGSAVLTEELKKQLKKFIRR